MPLQKKPPRSERPLALSFRFSEEAARQLKIICSVLNQKQIHVMEELLRDEYARCQKKYPEEVKKAEKKAK